MTGVVDSLGRRGFVHRSPNPADRRSLLIEITDEGLLVVQQLRTLIHRHEREWMADFSETEVRAYIDVLHRLQDRLAP